MRKYLTELNNEIEKIANSVEQYNEIPPEMESVALGILCDMMEEVHLRANTQSNTQRDIFLSFIYLKFNNYLEDYGKRLIPEGILNTNSPHYVGQCILMSLIDILELYIKDNVAPNLMQFMRVGFIFDETMSDSKSVEDSINDFFDKCQDENIHPLSILLKLIEIEKST